MSFENKKDVKRGNFIKIRVCIHTSFPRELESNLKERKKERDEREEWPY